LIDTVSLSLVPLVEAVSVDVKTVVFLFFKQLIFFPFLWILKQNFALPHVDNRIVCQILLLMLADFEKAKFPLGSALLAHHIVFFL